MANILVREIFGESCSLGEIPLTIGQTTDYGCIMEISGFLVRVGSGSAQTSAWMYSHKLSMLEAEAAAWHGWPTGVDSVPYDRDTRFPNGFQMNMHAATGITVTNGLTVSHYPGNA